MKVLGEIMNEGRARSSLEITSTMSDERWRRMVEVHLFGTSTAPASAADHGAARRRAHRQHRSVAGLGGIPGLAHYGAAKAGIIGFTKSVAPEVIPRGIYVNAVAPGLIDTRCCTRRATSSSTRR